MTLLASLLLTGLFLLITALQGIRPSHSPFSRYELKRLVAGGDAHAEQLLRTQRFSGEAQSLIFIVTTLLIVCFAFVSTWAFGFMWGIVSIILVVPMSRIIAHSKFVVKMSSSFYHRYEDTLSQAFERSGILRFILKSSIAQSSDLRIHSRDELAHVIDQSGSVLSDNERKLLIHSLQFEQRHVSELMVPVRKIHSISRRELLGPLVLDDLHKTGHSRFPVTDGSIDSIIGVLNLADVLTIEAGKHSTTAEKSMEARVFYIPETATLPVALGALLKAHHHMLIVVDSAGKTVGLVTIGDLIEALFGQQI